ncbi:hypothetical protein A5481_15775 [Methylobacterium platani]|uniref:Uncharacterized protein n=1 Tax=Methylobacterium platani TaxID=427683 RepID=A0A179SAM4_9HYPH|nr:hypothetical protein A5481_15775 [Methylobacterium platani]
MADVLARLANRAPSNTEHLPGQLDLEDAIADRVTADAAAAARLALGGNGGPSLDERPIDVIARIGRAQFGDRWIGKLGEDIGVDHRQMRRWLAGRGEPPPKVMSCVRLQARGHAARILRALEE